MRCHRSLPPPAQHPSPESCVASKGAGRALCPLTAPFSPCRSPVAQQSVTQPPSKVSACVRKMKSLGFHREALISTVFPVFQPCSKKYFFMPHRSRSFLLSAVCEANPWEIFHVGHTYTWRVARGLWATMIRRRERRRQIPMRSQSDCSTR